MAKLKAKGNKYVTMGKIVSLVLVFFGFLALVGSLGGDTSYPGSAPYSYDSGYATFGGDFYTYVTNNAAEAASASRTAAYNIGDIADLLKSVCGVSMMCFGLISFCAFGIIGGKCKNEAICAPVAEAPAEETAVPAEETAEETAE